MFERRVALLRSRRFRLSDVSFSVVDENEVLEGFFSFQREIVHSGQRRAIRRTERRRRTRSFLPEEIVRRRDGKSFVSL